MKPSTSRKLRSSGVYVLVILVVTAVAGTLSFVVGRDYQTLTSFTVPFRPAYVKAADPIAAAEQSVQSTSKTPHRVIEVYPGEVSYIAAGRDGRRSTRLPGVATMRALANQACALRWMDCGPKGVVTIPEPIIIEPGASLAIGGPDVTTIRLEPGADLGDIGGHLAFSHVLITSWNAKTGQSLHARHMPRPSIEASWKATMDIAGSTFAELGWDSNSAYGVSWVNGATGYAVQSSFKGNFIGVYLAHVTGLILTGDAFLHSQLYGVDPHSGSSRLTIDHDVSEYNTGHGYIFSQDVTDSVIENSTSSYNGENGIMMDASSTGNVIKGNDIKSNAGDGVVFSGSPDNVLKNNTIERDRVGVHADHGTPAGTVTAVGNTIAHNEIASQGVTLSQDNAITANGGQWLPRRLAVIWLAAAFAVIAACALTGYRRRRRYARRAPARDRGAASAPPAGALPPGITICSHHGT